MMRILIFEVNWLGDVLFSTPAIKAIRKKYPDSHIAVLVVPRCRQILEHNPFINETIIYDQDGKHRTLAGKLEFINQLHQRHFDKAFIFHRSFTRALLIYLAGIPQRIGYSTKGRGFLLTEKIAVPGEKLHKVEYFLNMVRSAGIDTEAGFCEFYISDQDRAWALQILDKQGIDKNDFIVILNPGGNWGPKRWPLERFAEVGDRLVEQYKARIIITGGLKDEQRAIQIAALMKHRPISFCGMTDLNKLGALLDRADMVISADSGPMHIAVARGTKVIGLFGPTSPRITGPYGRGNHAVLWKDIGCQVPCYDTSCTDNRCMKAITVEDVLKAVKTLNRKEHERK